MRSILDYLLLNKFGIAKKKQYDAIVKQIEEQQRKAKKQSGFLGAIAPITGLLGGAGTSALLNFLIPGGGGFLASALGKALTGAIGTYLGGEAAEYGAEQGVFGESLKGPESEAYIRKELEKVRGEEYTPGSADFDIEEILEGIPTAESYKKNLESSQRIGALGSGAVSGVTAFSPTSVGGGGAPLYDFSKTGDRWFANLEDFQNLFSSAPPAPSPFRSPEVVGEQLQSYVPDVGVSGGAIPRSMNYNPNLGIGEGYQPGGMPIPSYGYKPPYVTNLVDPAAIARERAARTASGMGLGSPVYPPFGQSAYFDQDLYNQYGGINPLSFLFEGYDSAGDSYQEGGLVSVSNGQKRTDKIEDYYELGGVK